MLIWWPELATSPDLLNCLCKSAGRMKRVEHELVNGRNTVPVYVA
jgi:hypothetical protein